MSLTSGQTTALGQGAAWGTRLTTVSTTDWEARTAPPGARSILITNAGPAVLIAACPARTGAYAANGNEVAIPVGESFRLPLYTTAWSTYASAASVLNVTYSSVPA